MVNRVTRVMSKDDTRRFCLFNQLPILRKYERFEKEEETFDLVGRVHMDYLELYRKYNYESRHSYKLDSIGEIEVGEKKTQYEGTLDQLYNRDWKRFLEYNRQDTMLLFKIHNKLKFLDLANSIAHQNTVLLPTVMGSVALIEQAVINEAHQRGLVVPNKRRINEETEPKAAGAYVATPKRGMHEWVAAVDLNSLYPSTIRALNMAPETIVGQIRLTTTNKYIADKMAAGADFAQAWDGLFSTFEYAAVMNQEVGTILTIDWERGGSETASAAEIWKLIFDSNQPWMLSANGTIFTYEREGVIPGLLTRWYSERKDLQKKLKESTTDADKEFYDKRQLVRKILLNSAYGALLNIHCRFYDHRVGQSTTLNGRTIAKHMSSHINESITGKYDHSGQAIVYGDSVTGDTIIRTSEGDICIADLFEQCLEHVIVGEKEYGVWNETKVLGFNSEHMEKVAAPISCVMRHKTKKKLYKITTANGKSVTVTEDHSVMVDRDGFLIECKPTEILESDLIITLSSNN
jgi:DNA polymerase elongation subunit (family B)